MIRGRRRLEIHSKYHKVKSNLLRFFLPDKPTLILWVPLFAVAMWYGISQHFEDMGLYTVAMAFATLGVSNESGS